MALLVYRPALDGPFVSDDIHYVAENPYIHELSLENAASIWSPTGAATIAVVNYTPVHLTLHALSWQIFGSQVRGHHVLNVVLHCVASLLLVLLLLRSGLPRAGAVFGGVFFLLHPANVEAVAWISQLKSSSALLLALAALLAHPARPALGTALFVLALLAKPTAAFALPVVALLEWAERGRVRWKWLAVWAAAFAAYSAAEFPVHQRSGAAEAMLYETPLVLVRTIVALSLRYVAMATTSFGVSAFHEPEPASSPWDPWWLAALPVLALLGWRFVHVLRRRRPEAAFWTGALVSFGPVSQIFPFLYPLADRYLYFILPGLIGGTGLAAAELWQRLSPERRARAARGAAALAAAVAVFFAWHANQRAAIWRSSASLVADAARHYPDGVSASLLRAKRAAQLGDVDGTVAGIRAAMARGYNRFEQLLQDPSLAPVRDHPKFQAVIHEIAKGWIDTLGGFENPTQLELRRIANAHIARGEVDEAVAILRRALEAGGPMDDQIRRELGMLGRSVR